MNNQEIRKNDNDSKKIFTMLILIFTLMVCTTGTTYAYFAFTATNSTEMKGTAAAAGLTLTVQEQPLGGTSSGTNTNVMVPQLESALGTAMGTNYKCVDTNGNIVCKVYKITIANSNMTASMPITGTIVFPTTSANLKWRLVTNATTFGSGTTKSATTSAQSFATPTLSATNKSYDYYIVVWINETNADQSAADGGKSWTATIEFKPTDGSAGLTSTIKS